MREMIAVSTFCEKKPKRYATWWHPNPNFLAQTHGRKNRDFQLDHFFMHGEDRKRVRDCGKAEPWPASDHGAIKLLLKPKTKLTPRREPDHNAQHSRCWTATLCEARRLTVRRFESLGR
jgi:hypothetical protein